MTRSECAVHVAHKKQCPAACAWRYEPSPTQTDEEWDAACEIITAEVTRMRGEEGT